MTPLVERLWPRLEWLVLFLAGPVIWYTHFWLVYLVAEAGCFVARQTATTQPVWLVVVILAATAGAVGLIVWSTWLAWRRWREGEGSFRDRTALYFIGLLLGPLFAIATVLVGLPAAFLPPC